MINATANYERLAGLVADGTADTYPCANLRDQMWAARKAAGLPDVIYYRVEVMELDLWIDQGNRYNDLASAQAYAATVSGRVTTWVNGKEALRG